MWRRANDRRSTPALGRMQVTEPIRPSLVVTLGEAMGSFVADDRGPMAEADRFRRTVAGAEANVAVGLARLGVPVAFVGRVGPDGLGTAIIRTLRGEGVDVRNLWTDPAAATGVMIRELRDLGPSEVIYWRAGSAGSRLAAADVESAGPTIDAASWLHISGITPALSSTAAAAVDAVVERVRAASGLGSATPQADAVPAKVSLDVNLRRRLWTEAEAKAALRPLAARCDVVLGSIDELAILGGVADTTDAAREVEAESAADAVLELGAEVVVVKLGADGAMERRRTDAGRSSCMAPAIPVERVVDPVGAGDAFTAGYIATILLGGSSEDALAAGNACGASAISTLGDQAGLPTRTELALLLAASGPDTLR